MPMLGMFSRPGASAQIQLRARNMIETGDTQSFDWEWDIRRQRYAENHALLNNRIYLDRQWGGYRDLVLKDLCLDSATETDPLIGYYNPVRTIVDAYQNVFRGRFGTDIKIADKDAEEEPVNPALTGPNNPIDRLWRWSNLDTQKQVLQEWAANYGTVGLRIVAEDNTDKAKARVSLQLDHPGAILDFDEDSRGNVTEVLLEYTAIAGELGQKRNTVTIREVIGKNGFSRELAGRQLLEPDQRKNNLGVCPYVLLRHRDDGREFGRWAYEGTETIIHALNRLITNQGESVYESVWATWFATAGGKAPSDPVEIGKKKLAYVQSVPDTPPPSLHALVPQLDQAGAREFFLSLIDLLVSRQPELVIGNIKALANQSGETIAKLLIPAEAAIERAKSNYEDALIRAMQIGLSEGIRLSLWDLGTGQGNADAADRAYYGGQEDFDFAPRTPLPPTVYDQQQQAKADVAPQSEKIGVASKASGIVSPQEQLKLAGYSPEEIAAIHAQKQAHDQQQAKLQQPQPA